VANGFNIFFYSLMSIIFMGSYIYHKKNISINI